MMPDKKLLPLSLMPMELELTVNPYCLYYAGLVAPEHRKFSIKNV